jgi:MFS-type transporter involved in bile tolerance (Atg22 family)
MFVILRLVILFTALWAFVGSLFYGYLLDYLGWDKTGLEARWVLFIALTLIVAAVTTAFLIGAYQLLVRICRPFGRKVTRSSG